MKFGVVIGICTNRGADQLRALQSVAEFCAPTTDLIALFNGVDPFPLPTRYEILHEPQRIGREQGVWRCAYDLATTRRWDWCGSFHDDVILMAAGWEPWVTRAALSHKLGIVSYACWPYAAASGTPPDRSVITGVDGDHRPGGFLGVAVDGCAMAFNMRLFRRRRQFTPLDVECGFGEMEAGFWSLSQGWGCARIPLSASHNPTGQNSRVVTGTGAGGVSETVDRHLDVLPASVVDENRIHVGSRTIDVRWGPPITVLRPAYDVEEETAVVRVLRRGWSGSGPETGDLEAEFAAFLGVAASGHVVATSCCTSALYLALRAQGWPPGSEVLVPPLTFVSTVAAVRAAGYVPVFVDVKEPTLTIDAECAETAVVPGYTRGILVVHLAGVPADMDTIYGVAHRHGLAVIEDCAHAVGTRVRGEHVGSNPLSAASCWSFNALKNVGAGDGGAIVCWDPTMMRRLRAARWCGIDKDTLSRSAGNVVGEGSAAPRYSWQYAVVDASLKHQMNELSAAVARAQLRKIARLNQRRAVVAIVYRDRLRKVSWLTLPPEPGPNTEHSNHLFMARAPAPVRDRLIDHLSRVGIGTSVHYKPINLHAPFSDLKGYTPVAHRVWQELVSLPMHAALSDADVDRVVDAVVEFDPSMI